MEEDPTPISQSQDLDRDPSVTTSSSLLSKLVTFDPPYLGPVRWFLVRLSLPLLLLATSAVVSPLLLPDSSGDPLTPSLFLLFLGLGFGEVFALLRLPPLLGMLTCGLLLKNLPESSLPFLSVSSITPGVSTLFRQLALVVILTRAGLGLDPVALIRLKGVVVRLAFCPCLAEALTVTFASHWILGFPLLWGLALGFVLAAVSPAVIVPSLLNLSERGFGVEKGIPTMVIAASSVDDILAISGFGIVLAQIFTEAESLAMTVLHGPLEVLVGVGWGLGWGVFLGLVFGEKGENDNYAEAIRFTLTFGGGCLAVFGSPMLRLPGAGPLGCLIGVFVSGIFWRKKGLLSDSDALTQSFALLWYIFQPLLFGLIGCEISFQTLDLELTLLASACLLIGLVVRLAVSYWAVSGSGLVMKERLFVAIAWVPKATVQAAIGPIALDTARRLNAGEEAESLGLKVLTIAVLVILITAPLGSTGISLLGPKLLSTNKSQKGITEDGNLLSPMLNGTNGEKKSES